MDFLAVRDLSRLELTTKLEKNDYPREDIEAAIAKIEAKGWLMEPESLSHKVSETLHRKKKSHLYIVEYLKAKGLPPVPRDSEREREKAEILLKTHFSKMTKSQETDKKKMAQFLKNRGFDTQTIMKVCRTN